MSDEELRDLLGNLAGDPPPNPGRSAAVHRRIAQVRRRRAVAQGLAASTAVLVVALAGAGLSGVLDRGPSTPDRLGADPGSSSAPLGSVTPTPSTATSSPRPSGSPAGSPAPTVAAVSPALLLGTAFAEESFGGGQPALVQNYDDKEPLLGSCLPQLAPLRAVRSTGRSWSWPDEVVAGETLLELGSAEEASQRFQECADPTSRQYDQTSQPIGEPLDVADGGFLVQERHPLFRQMHAGAQVGRFLVVLQWRQSGRVTSTEPLVQALRAAVAKATGGAPLDATAADPQEPAPELRGYLTRAGFPAGIAGLSDGGMPYEWRRDRSAAATRIDCGSKGTALSTAAPPVWRTWSAVAYDAVGPSTSLAVAAAPESTDAASDFALCRAAQDYTAEPVPGLGDEAYFLNTDTGNGERELYVRSGATYLVLRATWSDRPTLEALGQAALTAWQQAAP